MTTHSVQVKAVLTNGFYAWTENFVFYISTSFVH